MGKKSLGKRKNNGRTIKKHEKRYGKEVRKEMRRRGRKKIVSRKLKAFKNN